VQILLGCSLCEYHHKCAGAFISSIHVLRMPISNSYDASAKLLFISDQQDKFLFYRNRVLSISEAKGVNENSSGYITSQYRPKLLMGRQMYKQVVDLLHLMAAKKQNFGLTISF